MGLFMTNTFPYENRLLLCVGGELAPLGEISLILSSLCHYALNLGGSQLQLYKMLMLYWIEQMI